MRTVDIIRKKRKGLELSEAELAYIINGYTEENIPEYQISAFLMAVFFKGMAERETITFTKLMLKTGATLDLSDIKKPKIDKHSTGGVGDKTSIILAPLLAAAGLAVPMVCGRGLGHTGGTIDKLESIPGFRTALSITEFKDILRETGLSMMSQTEEMSPADRKFYALRDVTATVESIPLIASSIMSKKLAIGSDGLVLDVKVGAGAFMKDINAARELAKSLVNIGNSTGIKTVAILTAMEQPLGRHIGNSLEIKECLSALCGKWPDDLREVTLTLGAWMIEVAHRVSDFRFCIKGKKLTTLEEYKSALSELIADGAALKKFLELIAAQNGNTGIAANPGLMPPATGSKEIITGKSGYIQRMDAEKAGIASMLLGAGRQKKEDIIDPSAGIILNKKAGDYVTAGEPIATLYFNNKINVRDAEDIFSSGVELGTNKPEQIPLIHEIIGL